jgi:hypothetical protein
MVEGSVRESEGEIEASGDAIIIAQSIYDGLSKIADEIRELGKILVPIEDDYGEPVEPKNYMDGTRIF